MKYIASIKYDEAFFDFEWTYDPPDLQKFIVEEIADYEDISLEEAEELYESDEVSQKTIDFVYTVAQEYYREEAYNEYKEHEAYEHDMRKLAYESRHW